MSHSGKRTLYWSFSCFLLSDMHRLIWPIISMVLSLMMHFKVGNTHFLGRVYTCRHGRRTREERGCLPSTLESGGHSFPPLPRKKYGKQLRSCCIFSLLQFCQRKYFHYIVRECSVFKDRQYAQTFPSATAPPPPLPVCGPPVQYMHAFMCPT